MKIEQYNFPDELYYMLGEPGHIWLKKEVENRITIGIDDYAAKRAGEIEFVRTVKEGQKVTKGQVIGTFESGKWIGQIKAPLAGKIIRKNERLRKEPELLNSDPYGDGWIVVLETLNVDKKIEEDEMIVPVGEKLQEYILWRISQE
ncbi:MAG: glycine cleavage system protein H [Candidatus Heimdallarchaeaceae archaeon]